MSKHRFLLINGGIGCGKSFYTTKLIFNRFLKCEYGFKRFFLSRKKKEEIFQTFWYFRSE